ncbi:MAG TPA: hypothetical protein VF559_07860 [Caulobacteraceae bacterium]|jgi:hypothetical protein
MPRRFVHDCLARPLMTLSLRLLPRGREAWRQAMRAEFESLEDDPLQGVGWVMGCAWAAARLRIADPGSAYAAAAAALTAALIVLDWNTDKPALSIAGLMLASFSLGLLRPARAEATSLLMGGCLLAAHAFSNFTGWMWPFYQYKPLEGRDWVIIASVAIPAVAATLAGAHVGLSRGGAR